MIIQGNKLFTIILISVVYLITQTDCQRTYMRTCECEYITNGKCAYTLLLPIGETTSESCSQARPDLEADPSETGSQSSALRVLQDQVSGISSNVTYLLDWAGQQARLLSQLQGAIIGLQNQSPGTQPPMETQGAGSPGSPTASTDLDRQIQNLGSNIEALRESLLSTSGELASLSSSLTGTRNWVLDLDKDTKEFRALISEQNRTIARLRAEIQDSARPVCQRRGLLVSGNEEAITDDDIYASSSFNVDHGPVKVRINNTNAPGAWCPREPNTDYEFIEFDLGYDRTIYGTVIKGRYDFEQWVTSYRVQYASKSVQSPVYRSIIDIMGDTEIFPGSVDKNSLQVNLFWEPVTAGLIRMIPLAGYRGANKCMRADVIGCVDQSL